ncbi:DUF4062 domain-containing protein [Pseudomonas syringae]|uniref:DUF4062 domain-containing protein n=1 Tax=Pseudomonas syringae TaxID=317 RepID=UPI00224B9C14|nr:DUF4062 domain-containing protein [Pseudomonas syringae]UZS62377.1 DUF4062 domain-containing protein [Pseudomonas syringae]
MSYKVTLYNIFIASPSDVTWARIRVRDSIQVWNEVHTKHSKTVLYPLGWDRNSAPSMGRPAQAIINEKLVAEADLLIGVFWTRLGTPTENFDSGTVEEIELHIKAGKPTMLYFSEEPVAMASVDRDEYDRLQLFKQSCKVRGLYHQFESPAQFAEDFNRHLAITINELIGHTESQRLTNLEALPVAGEDGDAFPPLPPISEGLTDEAKRLLKEASLDPHGHVMHIRYIGGVSLQVNGKNMISSDARREVARWEAALHDLVRAGLFIGRGHKGEVFELTDLGYKVADTL